jgi:hypothetical protein
MKASAGRPARAARVAAVILNLRSESGASHQQHGKETAGENVERKAEAGPPHRDTGILNEQVMKEVQNSVSGEGSHNQPKVLLEACHGQHEKSACYQDSKASASVELPMTANKM